MELGGFENILETFLKQANVTLVHINFDKQFQIKIA